MSGLPSLFSGARRRGGGGAPPAGATPIGIRHLVTDGTSTDNTSFTTASYAPGANRLVLCTIFAVATGSNTVPTPTVTGNGLTWALLAQTPAATSTLFIFRALGASPTTGAVSITTGSTTMTSCSWSINDFSNVVTTGTSGSGAIVTANTVQQRITTGTATAVSLPYAQAIGADNATFAAVGLSAGNTQTPGVSWDFLGEATRSGPAADVMTMGASAGTSPIESTWFGGCNAWVIGVELDNAA